MGNDQTSVEAKLRAMANELAASSPHRVGSQTADGLRWERAVGSAPEVGSSKKSMVGSAASSKPMLTRLPGKEIEKDRRKTSKVSCSAISKKRKTERKENTFAVPSV